MPLPRCRRGCVGLRLGVGVWPDLAHLQNAFLQLLGSCHLRRQRSESRSGGSNSHVRDPGLLLLSSLLCWHHLVSWWYYYCCC
jgi:hypothetical protein